MRCLSHSPHQLTCLMDQLPWMPMSLHTGIISFAFHLLFDAFLRLFRPFHLSSTKSEGNNCKYYKFKDEPTSENLLNNKDLCGIEAPAQASRAGGP